MKNEKLTSNRKKTFCNWNKLALFFGFGGYGLVIYKNLIYKFKKLEEFKNSQYCTKTVTARDVQRTIFCHISLKPLVENDP